MKLFFNKYIVIISNILLHTKVFFHRLSKSNYIVNNMSQQLYGGFQESVFWNDKEVWRVKCGGLVNHKHAQKSPQHMRDHILCQNWIKWSC